MNLATYLLASEMHQSYVSSALPYAPVIPARRRRRRLVKR